MRLAVGFGFALAHIQHSCGDGGGPHSACCNSGFAFFALGHLYSMGMQEKLFKCLRTSPPNISRPNFGVVANRPHEHGQAQDRRFPPCLKIGLRG